MSRKISLSQGQVALVDNDDHARLNKHKWHAQWDPHIRSYYARRHSKQGEEGHPCIILMAREIMHAKPSQQVDHKNHDTLDNHKANLRLCTHGENQHNRKSQVGGTSRHKGVYWKKAWGKWCAQIYYKGRQIHLGGFDAEDKAGCAYDEAAKKYFGKFAKLNFPNHEL